MFLQSLAKMKTFHELCYFLTCSVPKKIFLRIKINKAIALYLFNSSLFLTLFFSRWKGKGSEKKRKRTKKGQSKGINKRDCSHYSPFCFAKNVTGYINIFFSFLSYFSKKLTYSLYFVIRIYFLSFLFFLSEKESGTMFSLGK